MTKYLIVILISFLCLNTSTAQQGWALLKGQASKHYPVRGVKGQPDEKNTLGNCSYGTTWSYNGSLYLYGSFNKDLVLDGTASTEYGADMWRYDTATGKWEWLHGTGQRTAVFGAVNPHYGTKGVAAPGNHPGSRSNPVTWVLNGMLYLYSGSPVDAVHSSTDDMWVFDPAINMWTWISGNTPYPTYPVFGKQGVPGANNTPAGLTGAYGWVRNSKLYLYGGYGLNRSYENERGKNNNVWEYNPSNNLWTWLNGDTAYHSYDYEMPDPIIGMPRAGKRAAWYTSDKLYVMRDKGDEMWAFDHNSNNWTKLKGDTVLQTPVWGQKGLCNMANTPGNEDPKTYWEYNGKLYQISGSNQDILWQFDPLNNCWTWIGGDTVTRRVEFGNYGKAAAGVFPHSQGPAISWQLGSKTYHLYFSKGDAIWEYNHKSEMWRWVKGMHNLFSETYYLAKGLDHELNEPKKATHYYSKWWLDAIWQINDTIYTYISDDKEHILWRYLVDKNIWTPVHVSHGKSTYIAKAVPSVYNTPGSRYSYGTAVIGRKLYMYGGGTLGNEYTDSALNELWEYDIDKNVWTFLKGDGKNYIPVRGTKGVPASNNIPQGLNYPLMWALNNKLYLYSDVLWQYDPQTNNWMWLKGDIQPNAGGIFGTRGVAAADNQPRPFPTNMAHCVSNGKLYFGMGYNRESANNHTIQGIRNTFWEFDPATNNWTWLTGDSTYYSLDYGIKGVPAATNIPGNTYSCRMASIRNKLYLYGGVNINYFNLPIDDLWEYDLDTRLWTWLDGTQGAAGLGKYNVRGVFDTSNRTGGHEEHTFWSYGSRLYTFGGKGMPANVHAPSIHDSPTMMNTIWSYETCKDLNMCYADAPVVKLDSALAICDKQIVLNAGNRGSKFLWNTNDTTQSIVINTPGKYWVTVTNPGGKINSDTTVVVAGSAPVLSFSDTIICNRDSIYVNALQAVPARYLWSTGETSTGIYMFNGFYSATVISNNGCYTIDSAIVSTKPSPLRPLLSYNEPLCTRNVLQITDNSHSQRNRGALYGPKGFTGTTSRAYTLNNVTLADAGAYYMVDTVGDCTVSDTLYVRVDSAYTPTIGITINHGNHVGPYVPLVFNANINYRPDASGLQWFKNDTLLSGETGEQYRATTQLDIVDKDVICVRLDINSACVTSDTVFNCAQALIIDLSVNDSKNQAELVSAVPNPVNDKLYIRNIKAGTSLKLYDYTGRLIYNIENVATHEQIDMTGIASGTYILEATNDGEIIAKIKVSKL